MCEIVDLGIFLSNLYNFIWKEMFDVFFFFLDRESFECCVCMIMSFCLSDKIYFFWFMFFEVVLYWKLKYCKNFVKRCIVVFFEVFVIKKIYFYYYCKFFMGIVGVEIKYEFMLR